MIGVQTPEPLICALVRNVLSEPLLQPDRQNRMREMLARCKATNVGSARGIGAADLVALAAAAFVVLARTDVGRTASEAVLNKIDGPPIAKATAKSVAGLIADRPTASRFCKSSSLNGPSRSR